MKNLLKLKEILLGTTKAKIISGIVAVTVVGGATGGTIYYKSNVNKSDNNSRVVVEEKKDQNLELASNLEEIKQEDIKREDEVKQPEEIKKQEEEKNEEQSKKEDKKQEVKKQEETERQPVTKPISERPSTPNEQTKPSEPAKPIVVGIDWDLTAQLRYYVCEETVTYTGIKKDEFSNITEQVCLDKMSCDEAISKISAMRWSEEGNNISPGNASGMKKVEPYNARCKKFNVPGDMSAANISKNYSFNLGQYSQVFAYTNSDGTKTITSLSVRFMWQ